jgi:hypothetical protein
MSHNGPSVAVRVVDTEKKVVFVQFEMQYKRWTAQIVSALRHSATPGIYTQHRYPIRKDTPHYEDTLNDSAITCLLMFLHRLKEQPTEIPLLGEIRLSCPVEDLIGAGQPLYTD